MLWWCREGVRQLRGNTLSASQAHVHSVQRCMAEHRAAEPFGRQQEKYGSFTQVPFIHLLKTVKRMYGVNVKDTGGSRSPVSNQPQPAAMLQLNSKELTNQLETNRAIWQTSKTLGDFQTPLLPFCGAYL